MATISILYNLQKIDSLMDKISRRLIEIDRLILEDEQLKAVTTHLSECRKLEHRSQTELNNIEGSVAEAQIKIQTDESALYGGKIRNPKELQDLQAEIESLKRHLKVLEDDNLDKMMTLDEAKANRIKAEENLENIQKLILTKNASLLGEQDKLTKQQNTLITEREGIFSSIPLDLITKYKMLRESKKGIAVSIVEDNSCSVCGSDLRPSELQIAKGGRQMVFCPSCGRILYVE